MNLDALIFMLSAWGFTLGLLVFCIIILAKNPQADSDLNNNADNDSKNLNEQR
jgi:hypothetical protein